MADNELQVRLLHAAKTQDQWKAVTSYPKKGEVCLEAINTSGATAFKIKIGDGTRPYCRNTGTTESPVWDFTSENVLPYFGSVIETSGTVNVVSISDYTVTVSGSNVTKKKLSFYTLSISATTTGGSTTLSPSISATPYMEMIEGENIYFTTDETGTIKEFYINADFSTLNSTATTTNTTNSTDVITTVAEANGIVSSTKKTITAGNKIDITAPTSGTGVGNIEIAHEDIDTTAIDVASTITTDDSSTVSEKELDIITGVKVDAQGHIIHIDKDTSTNLVAADIKAAVTTKDDTTWTYRPTAGSNTVKANIAKIDILKGHTVKFNQLVDIDTTEVTLISGHKYYTNISNTKSVIIGTGNSVSVTDGTDTIIDLTNVDYPNISTTTPTVDEVEEWLAQHVGYKDYYPYTTGKLISVNVDGLKTTGFNLYNPATGKAKLPGSTGTANLTNGTYCYQITGTYTSITDADGNSITPNTSGYFNVTKPQEITVTGGNSTTCIHLTWSGCRNEEYEPYWTETLDLSWIKSLKDTNDNQLFPYGLLSAGSVYDEVQGNKVIKRVGCVDLGSLTYSFYSQENPFFFTTITSASNGGINFVSSMYTNGGNSTDAGMSSVPNLTVCKSGSSKQFKFKNTSYTDEATFKTAMSGVMLYYELATPIEIDITPAKNLNYKVDDFGTEELIPDSTITDIPASAGFTGTFEYQSNFKDAVIDTINKVNNYKNPVRSTNDTLQTTGKVAVYDSDSTIKSSTFEISNDAISSTGTDNETTVPTVDAVVDYIADELDDNITVTNVTTTDTGTSGLEVTTSSKTKDVHHKTVTQSDTTYSTTSNELVANIVTNVTVDSYGHVKGKEVISSDKLIAADIKAPVTVIDDSMWSYRTTAKDITIVGEDSATIDVLKGKTLKWQQQSSNSNVANSTLSTGTVSYDSTNDVTSFSDTISSNGYGYCGRYFSSKLNHKYYISYFLTATGITGVWAKVGANSTTPTTAPYTGAKRYSFLQTINIDSASSILGYSAPNGTSVSGEISKVVIFDLTEMGLDSITSAAEFETFYPLYYYAYTATPVLINNAASGIVTTGFNQFNESTLENDKYLSNTGGIFIDRAGRRASSVYFGCFPSTNYYFKGAEDTPYSVGVSWYDAEKNWISNSFSKANTIVQSPSNARFFRVCSASSIGDICINLSWSGYRNGEYEPYEKHTLYFNGENGSLATLTGKKLVDGEPTGESVTIFPEGMKSAGTVYDFGKADSDGYIRKVTKRIGSVDLGNLIWAYDSQYQLFSATNQIYTPRTVTTDILCTKYAPSTAYSTITMNDKTIGFYNSKSGLYVKDTAYTDAATFKTAMNGVMLYYELDTPEEYLLDTPIPANYIVNDFGTEERIPNGVDTITGVPLSTPFVGTINYKSNFKDSVIQLIERVNNLKNPVQGIDNTLQTVGKIATYDSNHTVHASNYSPSNATIVEGATGNDIILPSVETLVTYVNSKLSSALTYKGTIDDWSDLPTSGQNVGDMYIASDSFIYSGTTYNAGDFFIWNGSSWDIVSGTTSVDNKDVTIAMDGSEYTVATIDGVDITIITPNLDVSSPSSTSGNTTTFVDTVTQTNGQVSYTTKTIPDAGTGTKGIVQLSSDIESATSGSTNVPTDYETLTNLDLRDVGVGLLTSDEESTPSYKGTLHKRFDNSGTWTSRDFYPITKLWAISDFSTDFATLYPNLDSIEDVTGTGFLQKTSNGWGLNTNVSMKYLAPIASPDTDYTFADPSANDVLENFIHDYYTDGDSTNRVVTKVKKASLTDIKGFAIDIPILSSTSATAGTVLKGVRASGNTGLPTWGQLSLEELDELDNLSTSTGYLRRKAGATSGYEWELGTPDSTTVNTIYNDGTSVSDSTTNAGIYVTTNDTPVLHKVPFSAIVNDTSTSTNAVTIILNGNFS